MSTEKHPGKRICQIIKLKPEYLEKYKECHQQIWKPVAENLTKYHIEDYSIHYSPQFGILIATMKYTGDNWEKDAEASRNDPGNFEWWQMTDEMQETLVEGSTGSRDEKGWWLNLEEVFRFDH
ncbi:L-rhamnose mutarotase [Cyberlindnera fabianii]|uniref:L-rhamnose mutarotase n=1 Tax=Cyberlindnera fabianii TaxID=36022 RepID=A0A1V2L3S4_CYBFA|nr:L-rhamnose mutarotase [Cyberlindnera fabianii]